MAMSTRLAIKLRRAWLDIRLRCVKLAVLVIGSLLKLRRWKRSSMTNNLKHVEPVVMSPRKAFLLGTMVDYYNVLGYTSLKARLPGFETPPKVTGTIEDTRPDLTCFQSNRDKTPLILEVVEDPAEVGLENRWTLLSSAASMYKAHLYFAVPEGSDIDLLKRRLMRLEVHPKQVIAL